MRILSKVQQWWAVALFTGFLLILAITAGFFIRAYFYEDYIVTASGRHSMAFRVFYHENEMFSENPIPRHLGFLMSYTDFIEIDSSFSANFDREMAVQYTYRAQKRLVIRHMGTGDLNRVVFEQIFPLSDVRGSTVAERLSFGTVNNGRPGGTYTIFPRDYIDIYFDFVHDHARQMAEDGIIAHGLRGFSGELHIEFVYTILASDYGLNQTISQGYRFSLTTEVYSFAPTGAPAFDWQTNLVIRDAQITLPRVILFVAFAGLSLFGLLHNIKRLTASDNTRKAEADFILKKYSNEIVVYDKPINKARYEPRAVQEFGELLKLAINLNKHIMCFADDSRAEFVVVVDDHACLYEIIFENNKIDSDMAFEDSLTEPQAPAKKT